MFSATSMFENREYFWNTVLTCRFSGGNFVMSCPSNRMRPLSGSSKPPIRRSVVVLPQPDGPKSVRNSFS